MLFLGFVLVEALAILGPWSRSSSSNRLSHILNDPSHRTGFLHDLSDKRRGAEAIELSFQASGKLSLPSSDL